MLVLGFEFCCDALVKPNGIPNHAFVVLFRLFHHTERLFRKNGWHVYGNQKEHFS